MAPNPLRTDRDGLVSRTPWRSDDRAQPHPQLLDPERELRDDREDMRLEAHRISARRLDDAVHARCGYAEQRWADVARARSTAMTICRWILVELRLSGAERHRPNPAGEAGWQRWC